LYSALLTFASPSRVRLGSPFALGAVDLRRTVPGAPAAYPGYLTGNGRSIADRVRSHQTYRKYLNQKIFRKVRKGRKVERHPKCQLVVSPEIALSRTSFESLRPLRTKNMAPEIADSLMRE
jgi:hypothetical protein